MRLLDRWRGSAYAEWASGRVRGIGFARVGFDLQAGRGDLDGNLFGAGPRQCDNHLNFGAVGEDVGNGEGFGRSLRGKAG